MRYLNLTIFLSVCLLAPIAQAKKNAPKALYKLMKSHSKQAYISHKAMVKASTKPLSKNNLGALPKEFPAPIVKNMQSVSLKMKAHFLKGAKLNSLKKLKPYSGVFYQKRKIKGVQWWFIGEQIYSNNQIYAFSPKSRILIRANAFFNGALMTMTLTRHRHLEQLFLELRGKLRNGKFNKKHVLKARFSLQRNKSIPWKKIPKKMDPGAVQLLCNANLARLGQKAQKKHWSLVSASTYARKANVGGKIWYIIREHTYSFNIRLYAYQPKSKMVYLATGVHPGMSRGKQSLIRITGPLQN